MMNFYLIIQMRYVHTVFIPVSMVRDRCVKTELQCCGPWDLAEIKEHRKEEWSIIKQKFQSDSRICN